MNTKAKYIPIHLGPDTQNQDHRFDTLISPSGTIAALSKILMDTGVQVSDIVAIDQGIDDVACVEHAIMSEIVSAFFAGKRPILMFTVLLYNSAPIFAMIRRLRERYGDAITIVLGWQLITKLSEEYRRIATGSPYIDALAIGDGELIVPEMVADMTNGRMRPVYERSFLAEKQSWERPRGVFSTMDFQSFRGLEELLHRQKSEAGISQVTMQTSGSPGCASAMKHGVCVFCALTNISTRNTTDLRSLILQELETKKLYPDIDRIYDVANQFLPGADDTENIVWLSEYKKIRDELIAEIRQQDPNFVPPGKYCYLTVEALQNPHIVELLRDIGVEEMYIGIDHLSDDVLARQHKWHRSGMVSVALQNLRDHNMSMRGGIVLGSVSETPESLASLISGMDTILRDYPDVIRFIGVFPVELLPGSANFTRFAREIDWGRLAYGQNSAHEILDFLRTHGYLDRPQQLKLNEIYIRNTNPQVGYEEVMETKDRLERLLCERGITGYTIDHSPSVNSLRRQ